MASSTRTGERLSAPGSRPQVSIPYFPVAAEPMIVLDLYDVAARTEAH